MRLDMFFFHRIWHVHSSNLCCCLIYKYCRIQLNKFKHFPASIAPQETVGVFQCIQRHACVLKLSVPPRIATAVIV